MITQSDLAPPYRTPPASLVRPTFPSTNSAPLIPRASAPESVELGLAYETSPRSRSAEFLGAPVQLGASKEPEVVKKEPQDKGFSLKLVVDLLGRAVLSLDAVKPTGDQLLVETVVKAEPVAAKPPLQHAYSSMELTKNYSNNFNMDMPFSDDMANGVFMQLSNEQETNARAALRRYNSDITGLSSAVADTAKLSSISEPFSDVSPMEKLPQTPRRENYFLASNMGNTPNNVAFNLTPQFSSMMNSMMYSPQQLRKPVQADFFAGNELFQMGNLASQLYPTVNMVDLMNLQNSAGTKNAEPEVDGSQSSSPSGDDSGDARLALKKIIQVKRDR